MALLNSIASWLMVKRMHQIELFMKYPGEVQREWFQRLMASGAETEWGRKYDYRSIKTQKQFRERVPLQTYDSLKPWIDRVRRGEQNLLWPDEILWFAKSSGTTGDKSKFIPVSREALEDCHYRGGKDMVSLYCNNYPDHQLFTGKNLALGGSHHTDIFSETESYHGDVSAIIIQNLPLWADLLRAPHSSIALMSGWEEKLDKMAQAVMNENMTSMAGVPSWMLVLIRRVLDLSGKKHIREVWPNLEVYYHGGVSLTPYREQLRQTIGGNDLRYLELYNASEGFFGIQDQKDSNELLLMLDYGIYYEFLPAEEWNKENGKAISLEEVEPGKNYAMVISTNAGLWRYQLGDTIQFTSTAPYRFRITGRTKQFINVFGEEVMVENAERALEIACEKTGASVSEYTVAPIFMGKRTSGAHEWVIEFEKEPESIGYFSELLDNALKALNSDYEAKRYNNYVLQPLSVIPVPKGTFYQWLKSKDKLGGQHKVPRLSNERKTLEEVLAVAGVRKAL
ncbi:MAG: GH3 auxin-responsive promoter [Bacteroidetes bacterium]|nr:MAG: GH3 auxin-responsive promoter [Bacteroidota bacterium]